MPFYQKRGEIPTKRHTQFRDDTSNLYWEELISRKGFSHMYTNVYHVHPPTSVEAVGELKKYNLKAVDQTHRHHHIRTANVESDGDAISSRIPLFFNSDVVISKAHVKESMKSLYRNGNADEVLFIHTGSGIFKSNFGNMALTAGDYLVIPRGVIWQIDVKEDMRILVTESSSPIETPTRYRNKFGQLLEHSPFSERDICTPDFVGPVDDSPMDVEVKLRHGIQTYGYQHHPFDIVGWDGYYFPYIFNINDFMPITGKIHQPPPVHQTFQANGFVICSFVPRPFDYHDQSVPAPYAHSNVDSDEIIYYVEGNFMSRKGIDEQSISYHPMGLPHGPQPGKIEESLGAKETNELAVMIDTFKPLNMTEAALNVDDEDYPYSWIES
ncbi:MAG: homogentisate 1,2-dioxygenase [Candidatus Marinimicrobia bacterium]|nr:homogentisate 1,2-dioxygenase [Candidatus Neomarinimicrobiota bacterium]MBT6516738.1 homogentisate 1,2-dioxygenase [Candidatus Neomarinimicrobiota bacterium]MBT6980787.1 homogentisate 1,2-dioxygenase [Candidatus Neomarinimicrobiota bacterium]MBT7519095.1 homogentisate 1,2-dioxygenase [Candidatus Neomarinimicrobiota bacterium]